MTTQPLVQRLLIASLAALAALVSAFAAISPNGHLVTLLYLVIALALALGAPPHSFIAVSVLVFAVSTSIDTPVLGVLPVPVYLSDFMVLLIAARAAFPYDRIAANRQLSGLPSLLFALWVLVMAIAAVRAVNAGVPFASAVRGDLALMYWPLLYFGFARILRERRLEAYSLWRSLALVAVGLAGWMVLTRALNMPFDDGGLAGVSTGDDTMVRRDFGFAGAFIVYPALALVGIAGMAHSETRALRWTVFASVGTIATLLTLVRGEILGLALGALVILWMRPRRAGTSARVRTAVQLAFAVVTAAVALIAVTPTLGQAVIQRALPFTEQAEGAKENAAYRQKAVDTGFRVARSQPTGLGVLDVDRLDAERIDRDYLAHSGVATLLLFGGWPALITALLAIFLIMRRSTQMLAATPWLNPAFIGVMTMLCAYSYGAAGLAGDPWVIPLGALAVALRFNVQPTHERSRLRATRASADSFASARA